VTSEHPTWEGWEDSSVPPDRLGDYLRAFRALLDKYDYIGDFYGHFGQGCLHTRINFDLFTAPGITKFRRFIGEAAELVVSFGGSLSGEHGDGQSRAEFLPKMFGPDVMDAFHEFKHIWDPQNRMNPGKIVDPYRVDENLRYGSDYNHPAPPTHFGFPAAGGNFAHAMQRCVGVGECRRTDHGTMCPSFQVTREEKHSTRGRAHLLWEMLEGDPVTGMWQNEDVKDALDLCLACKGCKGDCPVHVDMATYKAEFLSHYYEGHLRPRHAFTFGLITWWARIASRAPRLLNQLTHTPGLSSVAKFAAGMAMQREVPRFADKTFKEIFARRPHPRADLAAHPRDKVMLWPDTFNNHFHPDTAIAATDLLESAGFEVLLPKRHVCCGRPLYDYGFLDLARKFLLDVLEGIRPEIREGIPVVVLEPSCAAVFRDELPNMLPHDEDARRLASQVTLLAPFVRQHQDRFSLGRIDASLLYHGHCHQKAIFGTRDDVELLESLGAKVDAPDTGCCGMAGSFGFEAGHFDISQAVGERVLLPAARKAGGTIVADGFSCREQVIQLAGRHPQHIAQVLRDAQTTTAERDQQDVNRSWVDSYAGAAAAACVAVGAGLALAQLLFGRKPSDSLP
jgi:Fe-S oxidoreductase